MPLDALPDISDVQVIIHTEWAGEPPNVIEDQVTYPIVTSLLAAPHVKAVRAQTMFGDSYVFVVFEDGTDLYWARSRVTEYLQQIGGTAAGGRASRHRPDATGAGWVYEYAVVDRSHTKSLADLRALQDWYLRYQLETVPGVAEVATHWRLCPPVPGEARSQQAVLLWHSGLDGHRSRARKHQRSRRRRAGDERRRIHGPRPRLSALALRSGKCSRRDEERNARAGARSGQRVLSARTCAAARPTGRAKAKPSAASWSCATA